MQYPGSPNSEMRHCVVSCIQARKHGPWTARAFGIMNEYQGFLFHDLFRLPSRFRGQTPWAFDPADLSANEMGFSSPIKSPVISMIEKHAISAVGSETAQCIIWSSRTKMRRAIVLVICISLSACWSDPSTDQAIVSAVLTHERACDYEVKAIGIGEGDSHNAYILLVARHGDKEKAGEILAQKDDAGRWRIYAPYVRRVFKEFDVYFCLEKSITKIEVDKPISPVEIRNV